MRIEGGCLPGKAHYSADVQPTFVGVCHCKNCQKGTGSGPFRPSWRSNASTYGAGRAANIHWPG
jgi:hypothetical protein